MQGDHDVGRSALEQRDVSDLESEAVVPEPLGEGPAPLDHVLLQVEAHDLRVETPLDREQVVERERQVGLAGPEVDDAERP